MICLGQTTVISFYIKCHFPLSLCTLRITQGHPPLIRVWVLHAVTNSVNICTALLLETPWGQRLLKDQGQHCCHGEVSAHTVTATLLNPYENLKTMSKYIN